MSVVKALNANGQFADKMTALADAIAASPRPLSLSLAITGAHADEEAMQVALSTRNLRQAAKIDSEHTSAVLDPATLTSLYLGDPPNVSHDLSGALIRFSSLQHFDIRIGTLRSFGTGLRLAVRPGNAMAPLMQRQRP
ncbi:hypothetical protein SPRG_02928 [Saprolegnia parasitica CBS 223.65]|uniref:Uncharacterized protein n=1 Tax=Saprolegnia parasitica (strain CBS 223.65) TaxID=695850 RepID=A0A067D0Z3_SAPPC|nr:hypothetical protein SPRG_02928 [Saprolegnia parasitica CBS 223.65]KDO32451.1 hypothetical protein SPRG_02928 [Saprolegnia parasitica CBS 223.65]|eukprot:XP_012196902.1 hypothetical protein SPRG_02928 [Saprolegnia parasitica CBS 223.65]